jgi:hypothetical protein
MDLFSTPTKENCKALEAASKKAKEDFDTCQKSPSPVTTTTNPVASVPGQSGQSGQPVPVATQEKPWWKFGYGGKKSQKPKKTYGGKKSRSQKPKKSCGGKKSQKKSKGGKKSRSQKKR